MQEQDFKAPKQKISDETELAEYRLRKRKEFEDLVRRVRWNSSVWVKVMPWHTPTTPRFSTRHLKAEATQSAGPGTDLLALHPVLAHLGNLYLSLLYHEDHIVALSNTSAGRAGSLGAVCCVCIRPES